MCVNGTLHPAAAGACACLGLVVAVAGVAFVFEGYSAKMASAGLDPGGDFDSLGKSCKISNIKHCWIPYEDEDCEATNGNFKSKCCEGYTPTFTLPNNTALLADGKRVVVRSCFDIPGKGVDCVCGSACEASYCDRKGFQMCPGDVVECWKPTRNLTDEEKKLYKCANNECVTVVNPGETKEQASGKSADTLSMGATIAFAGLLCMSGGVTAIIMKFKNKDPNGGTTASSTESGED